MVIINFIKNLKMLRQQNKINQKEFAQILGLKHKVYNHYETGRLVPKINICLDVANYFKVPVDFLLRPFSKRSYDEAKLNYAISNLSDDDLENVKQYVAFISQKKNI